MCNLTTVRKSRDEVAAHFKVRTPRDVELNVPEETLAALRELFQACNQARYARQGSNEELAALIPTVEFVLTELKKIPA